MENMFPNYDTKSLYLDGRAVNPIVYGKPDSQARFWNGMSRPSASACDAVARDFEHFIFKVKIVMFM